MNLMNILSVVVVCLFCMSLLAYIVANLMSQLGPWQHVYSLASFVIFGVWYLIAGRHYLR